MSTRCQVQVVQEGLNWSESVTLYHHHDGYPSNMVSMIAKTYEQFSQPRDIGTDKPLDEKWMLGRAGHVAAFLCAVDPFEFEPEDGHDLHGDIEYYYRLYIVNTQRGSTAEEPAWELEIYTSHSPNYDDPTWKARSKAFWNEPTVNKMMLLCQRQAVEGFSLIQDWSEYEDQRLKELQGA